MRGLGTLLNVAPIAAGASAGTLLGDRLPQRLRDTLVACFGPLAVLGAFADGLRGDLSLLGVKSLMDGFAMLAFASYLGWGVAASGLAVHAYQGGLTALAAVLDQVGRPPW